MSATELWQVKLPSGDILTVTLEQLDAALEEGHVGADTWVREAGSTRWATLGEVAGLEPVPPKPSAPRVDPFVVPTPLAPISVAPIAIDAEMEDSPFAPSRKPKRLVAGICAACALVIVAALGVGALAEPASHAAAAGQKSEAHLAVAPQVAAPPVAAPEPAVAAPAPERLTDAQKKAALAADKKLKSKATKKAAPPRKPAKDPFVKGGNKHDPLDKSF